MASLLFSSFATMHAYCIVAVFALLIRLSFSITVTTPVGTIACDPVELSWQGGTGPWFQSILSSTPPNPAIEVLGSSTGPPYTWVVDSDIPAVEDNVGDVGQSSPFTIARPGLGSACGSDQISGGSGGTSSAPLPTGGSTDPEGGTGNASNSASPPTTTNTGGGATTGAGGTSQHPQGGSQDPGDSSAGSPQADPNASSDSDPSISSTSSSSTSSSTPIAVSSTQSPAGFNFHFSASRSSSAITTNSLGSSAFTLSDPVGGGGPIEPATGVLQTGVSSTGTAGNNDASNNSSFSKKNAISGPMIGGIIAATVVAYPFSPTDTGAVPRVMIGRSGYPASTFSSWGNRGDLDERPVSPMVSTEGPPLWEGGQGTIESRYQAAFSPGHAASSSIDRNDPSSHQRFRSRGPIPKSMTDARHVAPFPPPPAIVSETPYTAVLKSRGGPTTATFDEVRPQAMPSIHDMMAGRQPVVAGYPPSYTTLERTIRK
ncbi:hypothetical protein B0H12DRAFT_117097 [Mycena haematopus]|nr:hypothetical protein B0H12DRAFT_117097 [Mycena haematopus]